MTHQEIIDILKSNKAYTIRQKMFENGYADATTHRILKEASLTNIVAGYEKQVATYEHKGNRWIAVVFVDVVGYENYEWVWIEFASLNDKVSSKVYIFAKEIERVD